jgi:transposase-like protein
MAIKRKKYSAKEKFQVVIELLQWRKTQAQITADYGVHPTQQNKRKDEFMREWPWVFDKKHEAYDVQKEKQIDKLHKIIGQYAVEVDWLQKKIGWV